MSNDLPIQQIEPATRSVLKGVFWLLFGLGILEVISILVGTWADVPKRIPPGPIVAWLTLNTGVLFGSWQLKEAGRFGWGCCVLLFGLPMAYIILVIAMLAVVGLPH